MSFVKKRGALAPRIVILEFESFVDVRLNLCHGNSYLLHGISVTNGYAAVVFGIEVVGNAEGSTDLVLAAISLTDRAGLVEVNGEFLSKLVVKLERLVGELLGKRKHCCLEGSKRRMKMKNGTNVAAIKLLLIVSINKECERNTVCTKGGLDYVRNVMLVGLGIEIGHILAGMSLMLAEVVVGSVSNAPKLAPTEREEIFQGYHRL